MGKFVLSGYQHYGIFSSSLVDWFLGLYVGGDGAIWVDLRPGVRKPWAFTITSSAKIHKDGDPGKGLTQIHGNHHEGKMSVALDIHKQI